MIKKRSKFMVKREVAEHNRLYLAAKAEAANPKPKQPSNTHGQKPVAVALALALIGMGH